MFFVFFTLVKQHPVKMRYVMPQTNLENNSTVATAETDIVTLTVMYQTKFSGEQMSQPRNTKEEVGFRFKSCLRTV